MKKIFILFLSIAALASCSNDDDGENETAADPIIGTWVLVQASSPVVSTEDCTEESTITFNQDNTGSGVFYLDGDFECAPQTSEGGWENLGDSNYEVEVPVAGELQGSVVFSSDDNFIFTSGFGTFTFERQ